jgi:hypothetical protein
LAKAGWVSSGKPAIRDKTREAYSTVTLTGCSISFGSLPVVRTIRAKRPGLALTGILNLIDVGVCHLSNDGLLCCRQIAVLLSNAETLEKFRSRLLASLDCVKKSDCFGCFFSAVGGGVEALFLCPLWCW